MTRFIAQTTVRLVPALLCGAAIISSAAAMDPREPPAADKPAPLAALSVEAVRQAVRDELNSRDVPAELRQEVEGLWDAVPADGEMRLQAALTSAALVEPLAVPLIELIGRPLAAPPPDDGWLASAAADTFLTRQLRLAYGRWLCHGQYYDDALRVFDGLDPAASVHPAALLFFRAVAHQRLAQRDAGLADAEALLNRLQDAPARYRAVAELMRRDLEPLKGESLDLISRQMDDVRRRLALGQGGQPTQKVEDDVLAALDKLIDQVEQQQRQQQQQQSAGDSGSGSNRPSGSPAGDSKILGGSGPGETTPRDIGSRGNWGDLPPKDRQEALQQIGRDFPAHYRNIVEQYFRRLANQAAGQAADGRPE